MEKRYFECKNCGQVVQGVNASEMIRCCEYPDYQEITDEYEAEGGGQDK